ncbi:MULTISPECIES: hypothetical protein [Nostocales]|uniref:Uncharacterized protein n=3 Tax=Nostocales TaxID=1161 RepID=A0A8S9T125_9CYAN|nr:hypothetical protein [Tolypothrix bouteillei]KAF3885183.1 hypothetical protein DA73_0400006700 [Tolypothrix bouteillei VB521301]
MNRTLLFKLSIPLIAAPLLSIFTPLTAMASLSNQQTPGLEQEIVGNIGNSILVADRDDYRDRRRDLRDRRREIRREMRRLRREERRLDRRYSDRDRYRRVSDYDRYRGGRNYDRRYRDRDYYRYYPWR